MAKKVQKKLVKVQVKNNPSKKFVVVKARPKPKKLRSTGSGQGNAPVGVVAASYAQAFAVKNFMQKSMVLKGIDLLYVVSPSSNIPDSSVLAEFNLNPLQLTSATRLRQFAPLWDKFKFKSLCVAYKAACGTDTQGLLGVCADPDKLDGYTQLVGLPLDQKMSSSLHNISSPPNLPFTLKISDKKFFGESRFMEPNAASDPRMYTAGKIVISNQGALSAGTYGRFFLCWEIEFQEPNIEDNIDDSIGYAVTVSSTYISTTYPWGNYSAIEALGPTTNTAFQNTNFVQLLSSVTLGSVIKFLRAGNYLVNINRTGVAMGTGAFSSAVFNGCSLQWDTDSLGTGPNAALANAGSTASSWIVAVKATSVGATMSCTGDAGVTHSTGYTSVIFVEDLPEEDSLFDGKVLMALRKLGLDLPRLPHKQHPAIQSSGPAAGESTGSISQGDGPIKTIVIQSPPESTLGSEGNPVWTVPGVPPPKEKRKSKKLRLPSPESDSDSE